MQELVKNLLLKNSTKLVMLVLDGLGGLPLEGRTELEAADIPNMDALARVSACGLHTPVSYGITPGSGPGHLALFGYDPISCLIGRGVLEALGLEMEVRKTDVAVRCNYATFKEGVIKDRRAGRLPTEESRKLTERLQGEIPRIDEAEVLFGPGMEHRFAVVLRFPEPLDTGSASLNDTDPQKEGLPPLKPDPSSQQAEKVARVAEKLIMKASEVLRDEEKANYVLTRGFSTVPDIPSFEEAYGLRALAIATYPMYRGLAKLIGMEAPVVSGDIGEEAEALEANIKNYDFFFVHVKKIDSKGEDGDFTGKAEKLEEVDGILPRILGTAPDVLVITGDHSTPSVIRGHSWHPVPVLLKSPFVFGGLTNAFTEREFVKGELGIFPTVSLMPLMLANSGRLKKYGA